MDIYCSLDRHAITLAWSGGKRNVTVWRASVRPSFHLPRLFQTLIGLGVHTQRDSPGDSTRRGQRTLPSYYENGHTCFACYAPHTPKMLALLTLFEYSWTLVTFHYAGAAAPFPAVTATHVDIQSEVGVTFFLGVAWLPLGNESIGRTVIETRRRKLTSVISDAVGCFRRRCRH